MPERRHDGEVPAGVPWGRADEEGAHLSPAAVETEEAFELLSELGLLGWSVSISSQPPLRVRLAGEVNGKRVVIERACDRVSDIARELAEEARALAA